MTQTCSQAVFACIQPQDLKTGHFNKKKLNYNSLSLSALRKGTLLTVPVNGSIATTIINELMMLAGLFSWPRSAARILV